MKMNHWKWGAMLVAGLLLTATLLSCGTVENNQPDEEEDDEEKVTTVTTEPGDPLSPQTTTQAVVDQPAPDASQTEKNETTDAPDAPVMPDAPVINPNDGYYSPAEVYNKLCNAEKLIVNILIHSVHSSEEVQVVKDGTYFNVYLVTDDEVTQYYADTATGKVYFTDGNDNWFVTTEYPEVATIWENTLNEFSLRYGFMFDDSSYPNANEDADFYHVNADLLEDVAALHETEYVGVFMERKSSANYLFVIDEMINGEYNEITEIEVNFTDITVRLPEVDG